MQYKNISDRSRYVVCGSVKQLIASGAIVSLSQTDIRHAGLSMRFFESVYKSQEIVDDLFRRSRGLPANKAEVVVAPVVVEPVVVEPPPNVEPVVIDPPVSEIVNEFSQDILEEGC